MKNYEKKIKFAEKCLKKIAYGKVNDTFKLISYLEDDSIPTDIGKLDLMNISEFKKSKDGYSVKFFDRESAALALLELSYNLYEKDNSNSLYEALIGGGSDD